MTRRWRPTLRETLLGALAVGLVTVAYGIWVGEERSVAEPRGDAVVVHAGHVDRLRHGLELMERGAAPTLVVMLGNENPAVARRCGQTEPYEIVCPSPDPLTTYGEALALGRLAEERRWSTIVTVTSDYHLRRASYLDAKCSGVDVQASGSGQRIGWPEALLRIAKEMAAMVQAAASRC